VHASDEVGVCASVRRWSGDGKAPAFKQERWEGGRTHSMASPRGGAAWPSAATMSRESTLPLRPAT
jgi:hypothetical protein